MLDSITRAVRRLAHPRSRRANLWTCVYCGAFETERGESEGPVTPRRAD